MFVGQILQRLDFTSLDFIGVGHCDRRMEYEHVDFANLLVVGHVEKQNLFERERERD